MGVLWVNIYTCDEQVGFITITYSIIFVTLHPERVLWKFMFPPVDVTPLTEDVYLM